MVTNQLIWILNEIGLITRYLVISVIVAAIVLMLLRLIINYADLNPFGRLSLSIRRLSDPLVNPVRRVLLGSGVEPKYAPIVMILLVILVGWFTVTLIGDILGTAMGVIISLDHHDFISLLGVILYGVLAVYTLLIVIRVIFSWGVSYRNPVMRFLIRATDPILVPFRRLIPPVAMFDISPIIAIFMLELFQKAIAGTLIHI